MQPLCLLVLCACAGSVLGSQWQRTDKLVSTISLLYDNIAHNSGDDSVESKKLFSVLLSGVLHHIKGDRDVDIGTEPAHVAAGNVRILLDLIRSIVDPSVYLVQSVCTPETPENECRDKLVVAEQLATSQCANYPHIDELRNSLENLVSLSEVQKLYEDLVDYSNTGDESQVQEYLDELLEKNECAVQVLSQGYHRFHSALARGQYECFFIGE